MEINYTPNVLTTMSVLFETLVEVPLAKCREIRIVTVLLVGTEQFVSMRGVLLFLAHLMDKHTDAIRLHAILGQCLLAHFSAGKCLALHQPL